MMDRMVERQIEQKNDRTKERWMDGQTDFPFSEDQSSLNQSSITKQLWLCTNDFIEYCLLSLFKLCESQIALIN